MRVKENEDLQIGLAYLVVFYSGKPRTLRPPTKSSMRTCNIICKIVRQEYEGHSSQDYKKAA